MFLLASGYENPRMQRITLKSDSCPHLVGGEGKPSSLDGCMRADYLVLSRASANVKKRTPAVVAACVQIQVFEAKQNRTC